MTEHPAEPSDIAEYEAAMKGQMQHRALRAAVWILRAIAGLYLLAGLFSAYTEYAVLLAKHKDLVIASGANPYVTVPSEPTIFAVLLPILREVFVSFFIYVSGDMIRLQLGISDELRQLRARLGG